MTQDELWAAFEQEKSRIRERDHAIQARYRANNPDKVKQNQKRYREKHREKILAYGAAYRERVGTKVATQRSIASQRKKRIRLAGTPPPETCVGCGQATELVFDHSPRIDEFRGWNVAIGINPWGSLRTTVLHCGH